MAPLGDWSAVSGSWNREISPLGEVKQFIVHFPASAGADNGDTFTVTLASHGCTKVVAVDGYDETTEGSVVVAAAPTTSVSSGTLTITIGGATPNLARTFRILAR